MLSRAGFELTFSGFYRLHSYPLSYQVNEDCYRVLSNLSARNIFASTSRLLPIPVDSIAQWEAGGGLEDCCGLEETHLYEIYRQKFKVQACTFEMIMKFCLKFSGINSCSIIIHHNPHASYLVIVTTYTVLVEVKNLL